MRPTLPHVEALGETRYQHAIPIMLVRDPQEYLPGQQDASVALTSLAEMLRWAQNDARSRSIWLLGFGLACRGMEMIATASAPQYDLGRFGFGAFGPALDKPTC